MRWTDVPGEGEQADGRASADHRRAQWEELRQRLEQLPPGHPSSPEQDEWDNAGEADGLAEPAAAHEPEPRAGGDPEADQDMGTDSDLGAAGEQGGGLAGEQDVPQEQGVPGRTAGRRSHAGDGYLTTGRPDQGLIGRHDPYRPWFTDGESAPPWFADESG